MATRTPTPTATRRFSVTHLPGPAGISPANPIAINPSDDSQVYVGGDGYVCRTSDGGNTWSAVRLAPTGWKMWISTLVVNPVTPSTIYLGADRLMRSLDYGETWVQVGPTFENSPVMCIAIDPHTGSTIYVATQGNGIYKSTDGSDSWSPVNSGLPTLTVRSLLINRRTPSIVYAGTALGICRSTNAGATWADTSGAIGASPVDSMDGSFTAQGNTILATVPEWRDKAGVWRSMDDGATWTRIGAAVAPDENMPSWNMNSITLDPTNPRVMYNNVWIPGLGVHKTVDGGDHWFPVNEGLFNPWAEDLAISRQNPSVLFCTAYGAGSIFKTTDGGTHWFECNTGLAYQRSDSVAISPDGHWLYASSGAAGVYRSSDGGDTWQLGEGMDLADEIMEIAIDPSEPNTLYAASYGMGLYKTTDAGACWSRILFYRDRIPVGLMSHILVDPVNHLTLYLSAYSSGVWKSLDGGIIWSQKNSGLGDASATVVAVNPLQNHVVLVGTEASGIFWSADAGETWTRAAGGMNGRIWDIAFDRRHAGHVYATVGGEGTYFSTDAGITWSRLGGTCPGWRILFDPHDDSVYYTVGGPFWINHRVGEQWVCSYIDDGLGWACDAVLDPSAPNIVYVGDLRAGVFKLENVDLILQ